MRAHAVLSLSLVLAAASAWRAPPRDVAPKALPLAAIERLAVGERLELVDDAAEVDALTLVPRLRAAGFETRVVAAWVEGDGSPWRRLEAWSDGRLYEVTSRIEERDGPRTWPDAAAWSATSAGARATLLLRVVRRR